MYKIHPRYDLGCFFWFLASLSTSPGSPAVGPVRERIADFKLSIPLWKIMDFHLASLFLQLLSSENFSRSQKHTPEESLALPPEFDSFCVRHSPANEQVINEEFPGENFGGEIRRRFRTTICCRFGLGDVFQCSSSWMAPPMICGFTG